MSDEFLPDWIRREVNKEGDVLKIVVVEDEMPAILRKIDAERTGGGKSVALQGIIAEMLAAGRNTGIVVTASDRSMRYRQVASLEELDERKT